MDDEISYLQDLIVTHKRRLQTLKQQVAMLGKASAPPEKLIEIEDIEKEISEIEQRIRRKVRNVENGDLFSAEEVEEIAGKYARIAHLEHVIPFTEDLLGMLKISFTNKEQRITSLWIILMIAVTVLFTVQWTLRIVSFWNDVSPSKNLAAIFAIVFLGILSLFLLKKSVEFYTGIKELKKNIRASKNELQTKKTEL